MELTEVKSTTVAGIGYYEASKIMHVQFAKGGLYEYSDISPEEYYSIKNDVSIGSKLRRVTAGKEYKKL